MLSCDKLTGECYCKSCCVDWSPGISDGLTLLRAYSVQHPDVVNPLLLEDDVDYAEEFATAEI